MKLQMQMPKPLQFNEIGNETDLGVPPEFSGYLTPDALMAYCETRLRGLDDQMQSAFAEQQKSNSIQKLIGDIQGDAGVAVPDHTLDLSMKGNTGWPNNPGDVAIVKGAYDAINAKLKTMDPSDPEFAALQKIRDNLGSEDGNGNFTPNPSLGKSMTTDGWNTMVTGALSSAAKDLSSSAELSMINLQSLMSQRQEAIQLATNLVQSLGDQANKIAENVGH